MKRLVMAVVAAFVVAAPSAAEAQAMGEAVCNRPVTQEEMAQAFETNDKRILQIDCKELVENAIQQGHIPAGSDCKALGAYVRKLALVDIPPGIKTSFAWVTPQRKLSLTGYKREARPGEKGLLNNQTGIWYASTLCCNPITDEGLPMPGSFETVRPEGSSLSAQMEREAERVAQAPVERRQEGQGNAFTRWAAKHGKKAAIVGAIAIGTAAVLLSRQSTVIDISNSNKNLNKNQ